jgi:hypothetical protein
LTLKTEAICSSETWLTFNGLHGVISQTILALRNHRCENLRSYIVKI